MPAPDDIEALASSVRNQMTATIRGDASSRQRPLPIPDVDEYARFVPSSVHFEE